MIKYIPYLKNVEFNEISEDLRPIVKLCDGKRTLNSIYIAWGKLNPDRSVREIKESMDRAFIEFQKRNWLLWKNGKSICKNDFSELYVCSYKGYSMAVFMEKYMNELLDFLSFFNLPCDIKDIKSDNQNFFFLAANISPFLFNKLFIRMKNFEYSLNFFLLLDSNKDIAGVISVMVENSEINVNIPKTTVGTIDLIAIKNWKKNRVYLTDFLNFVEQNIHKVVCFPLTKLRFVLSNDDQCKKQELISLLKHSGYEYEHTFKRECGSCDITFFSKLISHISTGE